MAANTTPDNITYPVSTDQVAPLETAFATMAASIQTAFSNRFGTTTGPAPALSVPSAAARNALFPAPVQGNRVWRTDLQEEEVYYGLYNATTNPSGRQVADWYFNGAVAASYTFADFILTSNVGAGVNNAPTLTTATSSSTAANLFTPVTGGLTLRNPGTYTVTYRNNFEFAVTGRSAVSINNAITEFRAGVPVGEDVGMVTGTFTTSTVNSPLIISLVAQFAASARIVSAQKLFITYHGRNA